MVPRNLLVGKRIHAIPIVARRIGAQCGNPINVLAVYLAFGISLDELHECCLCLVPFLRSNQIKRAMETVDFFDDLIGDFALLAYGLINGNWLKLALDAHSVKFPINEILHGGNNVL